jgi:hypothetical protein
MFSVALLGALTAFPQAINTPANPTNNPNQINVTPAYLYLNKMHYAGAWSSTVSYNSQDLVVYSSLPYISLAAPNLNNTPDSSPAQWYALPGSSGGGGTWGTITGTLSSQTDLQSALNAKQNSLGYTAENAANKDAASGYAGLTAATLLNAAEIPPPGASALGGVSSKTCTNQALTALSTAGAFTCATVTSSYIDTSIAKTGTDINTSNQVTATHLAAALPVAQGGTGTASTLSGLVRGNSSAMTASEISGDCTTSGSAAITCTKTSGSLFVTSATTDTTNAANITSGTLPAARLPNPSGTTLGGIESYVAVSNQFLDSVSTSGIPHSRVIATGDVPTLNQSTTGNAATATALAATPTLCSTGQAPTGILASGNATGCASASSAFSDFQTTTSTGTSSGTAITLFSTSAPALSAGKCYTIEFEGQNSVTAGDFKIMVDTTQVAEPYNGANDISGRFVHCNNNGVQNAQTTFASPAVGFYSGGTVAFSGSPNNSLSTLTTTQAIDWTSAHTIKLTVTAASGTYKGGYWHIYQN